MLAEPAVIPPVKEEAVVAAPKAELTEQTQWLIAVRDKRDKQAFANLFQYYGPRLRAMLARGGNADDVVQDAMLRVWHKAEQFDATRSSASAWIYRIAKNRQIDVARRTQRPIPEALKIPEPPQEDSLSVLQFDKEATALRSALSNLKPEQREVIEKVYLGELTHEEVRAATGLPLGTIKSRIRLALDKLRHEMKGLRVE